MQVIKPFGKGAANSPLRLSLCDLQLDMAAAWREFFSDVDSVEILRGDLMETETEAVVSPANSFGDMGGGVDRRIDEFYKGAAQQAITERIQTRFLGELPVGMAMIVPMPGARIPSVIAAPTMRIPGPVADTVNAYLALRAVLVVVQQHSAQSETPIRTIAVPGLCTGVGAMPCVIAARQMRAAYDNVIGGGWREVHQPAMAPFAMEEKGVQWRGK